MSETLFVLNIPLDNTILQERGMNLFALAGLINERLVQEVIETLVTVKVGMGDDAEGC